MPVCQNCKREMSSDQPELSKSFPAFTVFGGIFGAASAVATGGTFLVPLGVVVGALADGSIKYCEVCNRELGETEPAYHWLQETGDDLTGRSYRPVSRPTDTDWTSQPHTSPTRFRQARDPDPTTPNAMAGLPPTDTEDRPQHTERMFQEREGRLFPIGPWPRDRHEGFGAADDIVDGLDSGAHGGQVFGPDNQSASAFNEDLISLDDPVIDIDVSDWLVEPPIGGPDNE